MAADSKPGDGSSWWLVALVIAALVASYVVGRIDQKRHDRRAVSAFTQSIFISAMVCGATDPDEFACNQLAEFSTAHPLTGEGGE